MAIPTVSRTTHQTTPARPSISPLSNTSRIVASSPIAARDASVKDFDRLEHSMADDDIDNVAEVGEPQDDRSSSLSEPEDEHGDAEDEDGADVDTLNGENVVTQRSLDIDSEAETERLDQTPQKLRKHADSLGRTPSKLSQAATAEEDLSEPPSPLPIGAGAASSTSTVATAGKLTPCQTGRKPALRTMRLT